MSSLSAQTVSRIQMGERRLFVTFDDGPVPTSTPLLIDRLAEHEVKAVFFLRADRARENARLVRLLVEAGHEVGNHSFGHVDAWRHRWAKVASDLTKADDILSDCSGRTVMLVRPPFGHVRPELYRWCRNNGKTCVLWDVMPGDFYHTGSGEELASGSAKLLRNGSIIALHEQLSADVRREVTTHSEYFVQLRNSGWRLDKTISDCLDHKTD